MRWSLALALFVSAGCRPGEGGRCFCRGECRSGLVCAAAGQRLGKGQCVDDLSQDLQSGECVDDSTNPDMEMEVDPEPYFDLGTRRDFAPFEPMTGSQTGSGSSSDSDSSTSTSTGASSSSSSSSSSGSSSSSSSTTAAGTAG